MLIGRRLDCRVSFDMIKCYHNNLIERDAINANGITIAMTTNNFNCAAIVSSVAVEAK